MPSLGRYIVDPSGLGARKDQHVEGVAVLLIGVPDGVRQVAVLLDLPLNRMGRDALAGVAVSTVHDAPATGVRTQPKQPVVKFGN